MHNRDSHSKHIIIIYTPSISSFIILCNYYYFFGMICYSDAIGQNRLICTRDEEEEEEGQSTEEEGEKEVMKEKGILGI